MPAITKAMLEKENAVLKRRIAKLEKQLTQQRSALPLQESAEKKLRENQQSYTIIFENSPVAMAVMRLSDNCYVDVNAAVIDLYGYSREELVGHTSQEMGLWVDWQERQRLVEQLQASQVVSGFEAVNRHKSGHLLDVLISAQIVEIDREKYLLGQIVDITGRKRAGTALAEANTKLEKLFEVLPVGISVLDHQGKVVMENPALENILGLSSEGLARGEYCQRKYIHPDGTPMLTDEFPSARILQGETSAHDVEIGVVKEDGETVWTRVSAAAVPFSDWKVVIATRDITEHKRAEDELRESEARFRSVLDNSVDLIYRVNGETNQYEYVSPSAEQVMGYTAAEIVSIGPLGRSQMIHPDDRALVQSALEQLHRNGSATVEYRQRHRNGEYRWVANSLKIVADRFGRPLYRDGILRDITERKCAEEALKRVNETLEQRMAERTAALRESEEKYRRLFDLESDALFMIDKETTEMKDVNQAAVLLYRYGREELLQMNAVELSAEPAKTRQVLLDTSGVVPLRYHRRKDGTIFPVEITYNDFFYLGHQMRIASVRDITTRMQTEESLRLAAAITENMVEGANMVRAVDGVIIHVNARFARMFGYELDELLGQNVSVLNAPGPESPQEVAARIITHLDVHGHWSGDVLNRRKDGSSFWCYASIVTFAHPRYGKVWISIQEDITARKQAEEALRLSEERFRRIFANNMVPMSLWNKAGEIVEANGALLALIGYTRAELEAGEIRWNEISLAEYIERDWQAVREVEMQGFCTPYEKAYRHKDGHSVPILVGGGRFDEQTGAGVLFAIDLTQRKRAEEEIQHMNEELEQRVLERTAELKKSHAQLESLSRQLIEAQEQERRAIGRELHDEIGQSLTGLKIVLEMSESLPADERRRKIEQAQKVAGELLDRISALSLNLRPPMLDDLGLLPTLLWFMDRYTSETNIHVDFYHGALQNKRFPPAVETAVYRLIQEALTNVARHAKVNKVLVSIVAEGAAVEVSIKDEGQGFDVNAALALSDSGGLSGMRERVRLLDGSLQIESESGQGARISIHLPLDHKESEP